MGTLFQYGTKNGGKVTFHIKFSYILSGLSFSYPLVYRETSLLMARDVEGRSGYDMI